jgi:hypothetical protein
MFNYLLIIAYIVELIIILIAITKNINYITLKKIEL